MANLDQEGTADTIGEALKEIASGGEPTHANTSGSHRLSGGVFGGNREFRSTTYYETSNNANDKMVDPTKPPALLVLDLGLQDDYARTDMGLRGIVRTAALTGFLVVGLDIEWTTSPGESFLHGWTHSRAVTIQVACDDTIWVLRIPKRRCPKEPNFVLPEGLRMLLEEYTIYKLGVRVKYDMRKLSEDFSEEKGDFPVCNSPLEIYSVEKVFLGKKPLYFKSLKDYVLERLTATLLQPANIRQGIWDGPGLSPQQIVCELKWNAADDSYASLMVYRSFAAELKKMGGLEMSLLDRALAHTQYLPSIPAE